MATSTYNLSTWEAEEGMIHMPGQPGLHLEAAARETPPRPASQKHTFLKRAP